VRDGLIDVDAAGGKDGIRSAEGEDSRKELSYVKAKAAEGEDVGVGTARACA
jgi:hypothetical protein